jgi:hypothetical protein
MTEDYAIEQLENTFKDHAEKNEKNRIRDLEIFKNKYPKSEIPTHMLNDFSISEALHVICREINQIKKAILLLEKGVILPENWGKLFNNTIN